MTLGIFLGMLIISLEVGGGISIINNTEGFILQF